MTSRLVCTCLLARYIPTFVCVWKVGEEEGGRGGQLLCSNGNSYVHVRVCMCSLRVL